MLHNALYTRSDLGSAVSKIKSAGKLMYDMRRVYQRRTERWLLLSLRESMNSMNADPSTQCLDARCCCRLIHTSIAVACNTAQLISDESARQRHASHVSCTAFQSYVSRPRL